MVRTSTDAQKFFLPPAQNVSCNVITIYMYVRSYALYVGREASLSRLERRRVVVKQIFFLRIRRGKHLQARTELNGGRKELAPLFEKLGCLPNKSHFMEGGISFFPRLLYFFYKKKSANICLRADFFWIHSA